MSISKRLRTIIDLVTEGNVIADIGTDHGYVPISLLREGRTPKAIAVDLSAISLRKAKGNAEKAGVADKIEFICSDGLRDINPGDADTIIISGMGGILSVNILEAGKEVSLSAKELILSPHRDAELVRGFLEDYGFDIVYDEEIEDKKRKYCIIKGVKH